MTVNAGGSRSIRRAIVVGATWVCMLSASSSCWLFSAPKPTPKRLIVVDSIVPNQYIVVFKSGALNASMSGADSAHLQDSLAGPAPNGVTARYSVVLTGFAVTMDSTRARTVRADSRIAYVAPVRIYRRATGGTQGMPPWDLDRLDQKDLPPDESFTYGASGAGVTIYVVDDGVDANHADFGGRVGPEIMVAAAAGTPPQCSSHGTEVAGAAAGTYSGVAKDANIVSVRIFDCNAKTTNAIVISALETLVKVATAPAVVVMSIESGADKPTDAATRAAIKAGLVVVVAAGNGNGDACHISPARVLGAIAVGATDNSDTRWDDYYQGSNFGPCVALFAPGVNVAGPISGTTKDFTYQSVGTSFAAPLVAGVAAQYLELHPSAGPARVRKAIVDMAQLKVKNEGPGSTKRLLFTTL